MTRCGKLKKSKTPGRWYWLCDPATCREPYHKLPGVPSGPAIHSRMLGLERDQERRWVRWGRTT